MVLLYCPYKQDIKKTFEIMPLTRSMLKTMASIMTPKAKKKEKLQQPEKTTIPSKTKKPSKRTAENTEYAENMEEISNRKAKIKTDKDSSPGPSKKSKLLDNTETVDIKPKLNKKQKPRKIKNEMSNNATQTMKSNGESSNAEATKTTKKKVKKQPGGRTKFVGAHVSIAGGLENSVHNAVEIGARSFAMFLRSQRQWASKSLEDKVADKFKNACKEYEFPPHLIIPHGSYLMNCGSADEETLRKSRDALVEDLQRCEKLGLTMFNFHPGSTCGKIERHESIQKIADSINIAHTKTKYVIAVIENMSCQGHTIGGQFSELRDIIHHVEDKSRVGVCLDTCHAFAAGYNLKNKDGYEAMMSEFDEMVGLKYLKAVHLNDSKGPLGCKLDRHENIGKGKIGKTAFELLMNDPRFDNIPLVLETPEGDYAKEIKTLYNMIKK